MHIQFAGDAAGRAAKITLDAGEIFTAEVGSMIAMDSSFTVETTSRSAQRSGGLMKGIKRLFSGENIFLNHFTATRSNSELILGAQLVGDVAHHRLNEGTFMVQGGSWLGSGPGVDIDTTWAGFANALFSGEGIFWVKCSGSGDVLFNAFGSIYEVDVDGEYVVDTGHVVAHEDTLSFEPTKAADSWIASFLGGEGIALRFKGTGKLFCQTHNPTSFGRALGPGLKPRN